MRRMLRIPGLALLLVSAVCCRADTVFLTNGSEIEGTVTEDGKSVVIIRTLAGTLRTYRRAEVDTVVRNKSTLAPEPPPAPVALPPPPAAEKPAVIPESKPAPATPPPAAPIKNIVGTPSTSNLPWTESLADAKAIAKSHNKMILANFTGSDWCVFCKKLEKEVFATKEFEEWYADKYVLLRLDFPKGTAQDPAIRKQNHELLQKFDINGYPTVMILTAEGNEAARKVGFIEKSPAAWFAAIAAALKK